MNVLNWELSVLSRAVAYNNLSGAASHIGISQPQLSRIISKLEGELNLVLLDREAKRKSGWTAHAFKLAEIYNDLMKSWKSEIQNLSETSEPTHLRFGALEGMIEEASDFCENLFSKTPANLIELEVHDLNKLEELFFKGRFDFIFTSREPGKKKFKFSKTLGYQYLQSVGKDPSTRVLSSWEYGTQLHHLKIEKDSRVLVSNSLAIRRKWIEDRGGEGVLPSKIMAKRPKTGDAEAVLLVGADRFTQEYWSRVSSFDRGKAKSR